jgi:hypothetical protein
MKSKIDIHEFLSKMEEAQENPKIPEQTYEDGVVAALQWVLEELEDEEVYEFDFDGIEEELEDDGDIEGTE